MSAAACLRRLCQHAESRSNTWRTYRSLTYLSQPAPLHLRWRKTVCQCSIPPRRISSNSRVTHSGVSNGSNTPLAAVPTSAPTLGASQADELERDEAEGESTLQKLLVLPRPSHSRVKTADFVKSSTAVSQCPLSKHPEFAVIGRSNVGKSSLINMLTGRKALAQISKTPGQLPSL